MHTFHPAHVLRANRGARAADDRTRGSDGLRSTRLSLFPQQRKAPPASRDFLLGGALTTASNDAAHSPPLRLTVPEAITDESGTKLRRL